MKKVLLGILSMLLVACSDEGSKEMVFDEIGVAYQLEPNDDEYDYSNINSVLSAVPGTYKLEWKQTQASYQMNINVKLKVERPVKILCDDGKLCGTFGHLQFLDAEGKEITKFFLGCDDSGDNVVEDFLGKTLHNRDVVEELKTLLGSPSGTVKEFRYGGTLMKDGLERCKNAASIRIIPMASDLQNDYPIYNPITHEVTGTQICFGKLFEFK